MFAAFADQGAPWFLNLLGALLILISIAFITYKKTVRLDGLKRSVEKKANALFWKKIELYNFSDFKGVGISTAGRTIARRPQISYFVQLLGLRNLSIPGYSPDKDEVLSKARNIAQFLNLPLDEKSKIGFFGKRL